MGIFSKPDGYVKQIMLYLQSNDFGKSASLSAEMVASYPDEMIAHFLLAKSSFGLARYSEASDEGMKAFDLAQFRADKSACAVLVSAAKFMLGQYPEGYRLLLEFAPDNDERVEQLLLIFSSVLGDEKATEKHIRALMRLDNESAEEFLSKFVS